MSVLNVLMLVIEIYRYVQKVYITKKWVVYYTTSIINLVLIERGENSICIFVKQDVMIIGTDRFSVFGGRGWGCLNKLHVPREDTKTKLVSEGVPASPTPPFIKKVDFYKDWKSLICIFRFTIPFLSKEYTVFIFTLSFKWLFKYINMLI